MNISQEQAYGLLFLYASMTGLVFIVRMNLSLLLPFFMLKTTEIVFRFIIGATAIALLHHLIGTNNYGFFAPLVLSLAPISAGLFWGTIIILTIISVAILIRLALEPFNLPIGFRLATIILFDTLVMALLQGVGGIQHINELTFSFIAPILIIAWLGERYVRITQEHDWYEANLRLFWTILVTILATAIMGDEILIRYLMNTPELWLLILSINLLVGLKARTRLSEYFRFRSLFRRGKGSPPDTGAGATRRPDSTGPLTMDVRNRDYIEKYNPRSVYAKINKIGLKELFEESQIPHAGTILTLRNKAQLQDFTKFLANNVIPNGFVIKPANGYGGKGILLIEGRQNGTFRASGDKSYTSEELEQHCRRIIDGEYLASFTNGNRDTALIERRIIPDPRLEGTYYRGLPDIRIIVFRGVPLLAMARLPTLESRGRANLKQGAIGAGIELSTGRVYRAIFKGLNITRHPDTSKELIGYVIPEWSRILGLACQAQEVTGLGITGVDIVLDRDSGPLILEVNKRPGMEIQNITETSLLQRLRVVEEILPIGKSLIPSEGIQLMQRLEEQSWRPKDEA